ncbi:DUF1161 domain-containing protein [Xenorhabdus hominickii]|uniref:Membrane protein n=1 Tax=Xenorhabdus hominickii TaxID=351679 RepID=A0A2G0Q500_XENHO|nr:hypothetical protein A9255_05490 [Xenorhabdus hominickii]PHM54289.1 membrane protein [Xenorhabdus hominickii]
MKKILLTGVLLFTLSPFVAQATCESLKEEIAQKIIKNGVPKTGFKLDIVSSDEVAKDNTVKGNGKMVGYCDHGNKKIIYTRFSHPGTTKTIPLNNPTNTNKCK